MGDTIDPYKLIDEVVQNGEYLENTSNDSNQEFYILVRVKKYSNPSDRRHILCLVVEDRGYTREQTYFCSLKGQT